MAKATMSVRDAAGIPRELAQEERDGVRTPRSVMEVDGQAVGTGNPLPVEIPGGIPIVPAGSTGFDYSANGLGTPAGTLIATVPANEDRLSVEAQNQWNADITMIRDDGANGQRSAFVLAAADSAGAAGGCWSSTTFRGRLRFYGPAAARVSIFED